MTTASKALLITLSSAFSIAFATDGVLEINQTCALNGGCFGGDGAGYPITIDGSAGRSYRLTGDLVVPVGDADGIHITGSRITIDLNGFQIASDGCENATTLCTAATGDGDGIKMETGTRSATVRNGSIVGMMGTGVHLGSQSRVEGLQVRWSGSAGVYVGSDSVVVGNTAVDNDSRGIWAFQGSVIKDNVSNGNGDDGIFCNGGYCLISGHNTSENGADGIWASASSTVIGNTARGNSEDGIDAFGGSAIRNNSVSRNTAYGMNLDTNAGYGGNVVYDNTTGTVNGGHNTGANSCDGGACP